MSALAGGVFATSSTRDADADLRELIDELGQRSYDAQLGQRGLPARFDTELWHNLEETGLARLTSAPDSDAGPRELALTLYGLARHACGVPLAETDTLAGWLGKRAALDLPAGPLTVGFADGELAGGRIIGTAVDVPWGRAATPVLLVRTPEGLRVGVPDADSIALKERHNLAGEPRDTIEFDSSATQFTSVDASIEDAIRIRGAWSRCVQIVGALDTAARLAAAHTRGRQQFGRPLSAFQSVQHALAGMAGDIERARASVELAVAAADQHGFESVYADYAVTVAKITVGRVVVPVTTTAHQLHGAIGVTREHPLWLFTLRAQSWIDDYGTTNHYARRLGRLALDMQDPWDLVTGDLTHIEINTGEENR